VTLQGTVVGAALVAVELGAAEIVLIGALNPAPTPIAVTTRGAAAAGLDIAACDSQYAANMGHTIL